MPAWQELQGHIIRRYEELRRRLEELDLADAELVELERRLSANYSYPCSLPLTS